MSNIICVTNRILAGENFLEKIEKIAMTQPKAIILREKDLDEREYERLAEKVLNICKHYNVRCFFHTYPQVTLNLHADGIHLSLSELKKLKLEDKKKFNVIGTSIHSVEEAALAQMLGANYIIAGHIFETNCKKGCPPRGLKFLEDVCNLVTVPVYAIGGITSRNAPECINSGASGVCIMSALMKNPLLLQKEIL